VPLLRGETVNRKTDWSNLTDAQLQLRSVHKDLYAEPAPFDII
jgi:hypothetical protein